MGASSPILAWVCWGLGMVLLNYKPPGRPFLILFAFSHAVWNFLHCAMYSVIFSGGSAIPTILFLSGSLRACCRKVIPAASSISL